MAQLTHDTEIGRKRQTTELVPKIVSEKGSRNGVLRSPRSKMQSTPANANFALQSPIYVLYFQWLWFEVPSPSIQIWKRQLWGINFFDWNLSQKSQCWHPLYIQTMLIIVIGQNVERMRAGKKMKNAVSLCLSCLPPRCSWYAEKLDNFDLNLDKSDQDKSNFDKNSSWKNSHTHVMSKRKCKNGRTAFPQR